MEQITLKELTEEKIKESNLISKKIVTEQTLRLQRLFAGKISERYNVDEEKINKYFKLDFTDEAIKLIDDLFSYFDRNES